MITIVLADDHHLVREGLAFLLQAQGGLQVVGQAGDGIETMRLVSLLRPLVLVLDLMMPGINGLEVTRRVRKQSPVTRVVILSMHDDASYVQQALAAGAMAYVLKSSTAQDLVQAIREVLAGRRFLSPPLADRLSEAAIQDAQSFNRRGHLTPREKEVLQMVAEGNTNAAIAARLRISVRTVEMHRASLMRKLGLESPADLVRYAIERGIIEKR